MDMIGSIIGGGLGLAGSIFGANKASKKRKQMNANLNQQDADNTAWYNANAYQDFTQRADQQALMANLRDNLAKRAQAQTNMAVVTGTTPDQLAVAQNQNNETIANVYNQLGAMGQRWKDSITDRYMARREAINNQRLGVLNDGAKSYENLFGNGMGLMSSSVNGIVDSSL